MSEPALVHPIPRTRRLAPFLREAGACTVLLTIVPASMMMWWLVARDDGEWKDAWPGVLGISSGMVVLMLVLTVRQVVVTRMQGLSGVLDPHQSVTLTLTAPVASVVESFREALKAFRATETQAVGDRHVEIWATMSGCTVHFSCRPNPDGTLEIHVRSDPRGRWFLFDGGANLTNVRRLAGAFWWREMRQRYAS